MTMKERLKIHRELERRNVERVAAYVARQKKSA